MPGPSRLITTPSTPFTDQRPGTSGLRKKTRVFQQPHYLENFVQAVFEVLHDTPDVDLQREILVLGGDGRYFNRHAIQVIVKMAVANEFGSVLIGQGGLLSTPAMSAVIRSRQALGGLILSASHNPGGPDKDFGIKYNSRNGGPASETLTEKIFQQTKQISRYIRFEMSDIDLDRIQTVRVNKTEISIIDSLTEYSALMERLFDFNRLREYFAQGGRLLFDAMHGVTGPYARHIFNHCLQAPEGTVLRGDPLEDFGGIHPDPNLVHAANLIHHMNQPGAPALGAACDGDGDRNLIAGHNMFVSPGDSLAIITEWAQTVFRRYPDGLAGVARSMPTSTAVDRVATRLGIPCYETPTGWKFFGNLMDAGLCTLCGEESFGTGSNHIREKDGVWAVLAWLSILSFSGSTVTEIVQKLWARYGRNFYQRHDFEGLESHQAQQMLSVLESNFSDLSGRTMAQTRITTADNFQYRDPVDGTITTNQGVRILLEDGSRIVARLSGTGTQGATLRVYLDCIRKQGINEPIGVIMDPLSQDAKDLLDIKTFCGRDQPTVIT